ncbi:hypothetical protein MJT46_004041 [Ovis ammon polii x Ovis aries]|nr:hypothetical protein MJT46_004041 [Ovis ammon polii x Ovis aries]
MATQQGTPSSALRVLEEALGMGVSAAGDTAEAVAAEGAYYLEHTLSKMPPLGDKRTFSASGKSAAALPEVADLYLEVTITEASEDDYEYEEIPDDNYSIPEGEEDLAKAVQMVQEQATDTQILEQKTVFSPKHTVPEAIEDFLCNFLIKMGMTRTLDCFQSEWYELIQKGITELRDGGIVPDVYTQNMLLENENKILKKDLKHYKQAADKAREDLLKTQKERDFHRMHHKRIVQEKNKLINDLKRLKLHYASYEPAIRVLHEKHHALLKQKMLTSLERDRAIGQISGLQETLKHMEIGHGYHAPEFRDSINIKSKLYYLTVVPTCRKENAPEGPTQKGLREAREQSKCKTKAKANTKVKSKGKNRLYKRAYDCPLYITAITNFAFERQLF